ncbi:MAG: efflux RND transporter periplasmic adaptor subunit [Candidatus Vogelbacteria bacterium]
MKKYFKEHKFISTLIILVLIVAGWRIVVAWTGTSAETRYVLAKVERGTLISSVTGTGQVSTSNEIELKSKVAGDVTYIGAINGQAVGAGALIVQLDNRDAQKAVRDAEVNLASAKLALEKMKLQQGQQLRGDTLNKNYEDGLGILANLYGGFATTLDALDTIFFDTDLSDNQNKNNIEYYTNYNKAFADVPQHLQQLYDETKVLYQQSLADYQLTQRGSGDDRAKAIQSGYNLTIKTAEMIKTGRDVVRYLEDRLIESGAVHTKQAIIISQSADLTTYATAVDGYLKDLLAINNTVNNQRDTVETYPLDTQSQELTIKQRENALLDAQENLADYFIRAPFSGLITKLDIKKTDSISNGTVIGTLITRQKIAEISLNEVDVARVKVGNKATLTFDAVEGLSITGEVQEVDLIGAVTQGVVTYNVKIGFDTQPARPSGGDDQVKPGMSASAAIITDVKQDILMVPNSAVKVSGQTNYVEMFDQPRLPAIPPRRQPVEIGVTNDESTEIISGLKEGDEIVVRTITAQTTPTASTAPSIFGGGTRVGGGRVGG